MRSLNLPLIWQVFLLLAADGLLLFSGGDLPRAAAAVVLLTFLPGWAWLEVLQPPLPRAERVVAAIGLSLALTVVTAMLAVYLPGPLTAGRLLVMVNLVAVAGMAAQYRPANRQRPTVRFSITRTGLVIVLILLLAAALRLPRLGYAEFHEDEAEALLLGVRLLQGEDYALFLHRKGPAQMLVPLAFWLFTGRITEGLARLPFALSSIASAAGLYFLGRRWFGRRAGLVAALLWAVNGYSIAFGRMVQYQALIFFLGPLAIYLLYLAWQEKRPGLQIPAAVLLAVCLLAHFDALLFLPAAGYLFFKGMQTGGGKRTRSLLAFAVFLGLLAAFYIPYVLDPEFQHTAQYLAGSRVKPGLLYNNLGLLRRLDADYSSRFYLPLLALGLLGLVLSREAGGQGEKSTPAPDGAGVTFYVLRVTLLLILTTTLFWPTLWQVGENSLAVLPWLAALAWFWQAGTTEHRAAWLMFGAGLVGYVFLVDDPRTHLYILYPGAVLLAGAGGKGIYDLRFTIDDLRLTIDALRPVVTLLSALLLLTVMTYEAVIFLNNESTLARWRAGWDGSIWETIYDDLPAARTYFGYPKREGWKAVGVLRARGVFPGDFRSANEDFIIPVWYSYGEARSCYDTPAHLFVRGTGDIQPPDGYQPVAQVSREGEPRLTVFRRGQSDPPPAMQVYRLEDWEAEFDAQATPERFARQNTPSRPVEAQFGPAIKFLGFDLPAAEVTAGETLAVNLYWQALAPPGDRYRAFVHLTDGQTLWAQQDDDPACRLPTTVWRAGQRGMGQFRLAVRPDTPPGRYPLVIGLYQADTLERLKITAGAGQPGDDFLWLGDVEVRAR